MNPQIFNMLRQIGVVIHAGLINFPDYVRVGVSFLRWLVVALAALAATYLALRAIWVAVQISLRALGIEGG